MMTIVKNLVFSIVSLVLLFVLMCSFLSVDVGNYWYRPLASYFYLYLIMVVLIVLFFALYIYCLKKHPIRIPCPLAIMIFAIIYFLICLGFVLIRHPEAIEDQIAVLKFTLESMKGQYAGIFKGTYISMYPYQLGLVAYQTIVLRIVELFDPNVVYNFEAAVLYLSIANCLMATMSVCFGMLVVYSYNRKQLPVYMLAMLMFVPGFLYCASIYNDVPSLTFALSSLWLFEQYHKNPKRFYLVLSAILIGIATIIRMTAIIFAIAYFLILLFHFLFEERKIAILPLCLLMMIMPLVLMKAPIIYYANESDYEEALGRYGAKLDDGCPYLANIAMGFDVERGSYGWYNGLNMGTHIDACNFDSACTLEKSKEELAYSFALIGSDATLAYDFLSKKIVSQWCAPDFGALFETAFKDENVERSLKYLYSWDNFNLLLNCFLKGLMIVVSGLAFVGYLKKRDRNIMDHTLEIIVTGGFLFSIIWEAKSRYNLPYVYLLIILACVELGRIELSVFNENSFLNNDSHKNSH